MAEAMLIGAGLGAGSAMLSGNDPLTGAAVGGAVGGASAGFGGAGVTSGSATAGSIATSFSTNRRTTSNCNCKYGWFRKLQ